MVFTVAPPTASTPTLYAWSNLHVLMRDAFRSKAWDLNQPVGKFWPNILANHRNILTMACQWSPATHAKFSSFKQ